MPKFNKKHKSMQPARVLAIGFFAIIICGAFLLWLPFSTKSGDGIDFIDALFTATSATCVTGISLFDTYETFSLFGQTVLMLLMQVGGIGFITLVTFFNIAIGGKMGLTRQKIAAGEFDMERLDTVKGLLSQIIIYSLVIETAGAISLMFTFVPLYGGYGVFMSFFHAVSAFCNGGFDVMGIEGAGVGFANYCTSPAVLVPLMILIFCGGLGFVVWNNIFNYKKYGRLSLHSRIVLVSSAILIVIGTAVYIVIGYIDPAFSEMNFGERLLTSAFASVSSRTAGFVAAPLPTINDFSKLFTMILMFIGAAPASTGGGIKVTTLAIIAATIMSVVRNREETVINHHRVKQKVVYKTLTVLSLSLVFVLISFFAVYFSNEDTHAIDSLFETVSAFSTTGYSAGISNISGVIGKLVLVFTMFVGRIGPVSLMLSLRMNKTDDKGTILPVGDIIVG